MKLMVDAEVKVLKVKLLQKIIYSNNGTEQAPLPRESYSVVIDHY